MYWITSSIDVIAIFCSKLKTFPRNIWPTYHFIVQFQIKKHFSRKQKPHTLSTSPSLESLINERIRCKIVLRKTKSLTCVLPLFPGIAGSPFDAVLRAWTWKQTTRRIQYFHLARAQLFGPDSWLMAIMFPLFTPAQPGGERWLWSVWNSVEMAWKAKGRRCFDDKIKTKIWDDFFFRCSEFLVAKERMFAIFYWSFFLLNPLAASPAETEANVWPDGFPVSAKNTKYPDKVQSQRKCFIDLSLLCCLRIGRFMLCFGFFVLFLRVCCPHLWFDLWGWNFAEDLLFSSGWWLAGQLASCNTRKDSS